MPICATPLAIPSYNLSVVLLVFLQTCQLDLYDVGVVRSL